MSELDNAEREPKGITRRTVTKSMAWAVPVIAVAATVPSAAATCIPTVDLTDRSCKCPGQSTQSPFTYHLQICVVGTVCPQGGATITITHIESVSGVVIFDGSVDISPGDECTVITASSSNSAGLLEITYEVDGIEQPVATVHAPPECDKVEDPIETCETPPA